MALPSLSLPQLPTNWTVVDDPLAWDAAAALPPFSLADGSGLAQQQTAAWACYDDTALYLRFECMDRDVWWSYTQRDQPLYDEEVVELFIAPGEATPSRYYEFEVNPAGALLDAAVFNPTSERAELEVDLSWDCADVGWHAWQDTTKGSWGAALRVPWTSIAPAGPLPSVWRANLYRIERPRDGAAEYSCWSPTLTAPADFHKPAYFGYLRLA